MIIGIDNKSKGVSASDIKTFIEACGPHLLAFTQAWGLEPTAVVVAGAATAAALAGSLAVAPAVFIVGDDNTDLPAEIAAAAKRGVVVLGAVKISAATPMFYGPQSMSATLSRAILGARLNPNCNTWWFDGISRVYAAEVCGPVAGSVGVALVMVDGTPVEVSLADYVLPAWTDAAAPTDGSVSFSHSGAVGAPFTVASGGVITACAFAPPVVTDSSRSVTRSARYAKKVVDEKMASPRVPAVLVDDAKTVEAARIADAPSRGFFGGIYDLIVGAPAPVVVPTAAADVIGVSAPLNTVDAPVKLAVDAAAPVAVAAAAVAPVAPIAVVAAPIAVAAAPIAVAAPPRPIVVTTSPPAVILPPGMSVSAALMESLVNVANAGIVTRSPAATQQPAVAAFDQKSPLPVAVGGSVSASNITVVVPGAPPRIPTPIIVHVAHSAPVAAAPTVVAPQTSVIQPPARLL